MIKKRIMVLLAAAVLLFVSASPVRAEADGSVIALGADLTAEERETVLTYLGTSEEEIEGQTVLTVTSEDAHRYLDSYIPQEVIGWNAISSCRIIPREEGYGLHVNLYNISYVTEEMYTNALATAGVRNADVIVASPSGATGTTALVGLLEAYRAQEGVLVSPEKIDSAIDEMVTTGAIADALEDKETAAQLIAAAKQAAAAKNISGEDELGVLIDDLAGRFGVTLSEENRQMAVELLKKLSGIKLDPQTLRAQSDGIYEKIRERGIDLSDYGVSESEFGGVLGFLAQFWNILTEYFKGLF